MVVVFDLDDTLYPEKEYKRSGINYLLKELPDLYGVNEIELSTVLNNGNGDWLTRLCFFLELPNARDSILWMYRTHLPDLKLSREVHNVLQIINEKKNVIILLTDGRSVTQRLKLRSLQLNHLPVFISEEHQSEKPELLRFEKIMSQYSADKYIYIGDNPKKDFVAPNELGWLTIGLEYKPHHVHTYDLDKLPVKSHHPDIWARDINHVVEIIC